MTREDEMSLLEDGGKRISEIGKIGHRTRSIATWGPCRRDRGKQTPRRKVFGRTWSAVAHESGGPVNYRGTQYTSAQGGGQDYLPQVEKDAGLADWQQDSWGTNYELSMSVVRAQEMVVED